MAENRKYETIFITRPNLTEEDHTALVEKFKELIAKHGTVESVEDWGVKKLAYPIDKKSTGFYQLIEFAGDAELINTLETQFRRDERVIRFLTVKLDKYAAEYAEKRRKKQGKTEA